MAYIVYMHVNKLNGKVYVGITHHTNPNKRWGYSGQRYTHCVKFLHAINKYGWENFDHIILYKTTKDRAVAIEKTLIAHYKRIDMSYNLADGGEGADCITELNRERVKEARRNNLHKGWHHTEEAKARIAEAGKQRIYTNDQKRQIAEVSNLGRETMRNRGYWLPEESIKNMVEKLSKAVLQLDLEGNIIREFSSTIEADKYINNGKRQNHIADVCNGKRKTAYGYKWAYKERRAA